MPPAGYPAFLQYLQSGRVRKSDVISCRGHSAFGPSRFKLRDDGAKITPLRCEGAMRRVLSGFCYLLQECCHVLQDR